MMAPRMVAASATDRVIGPAVSWLWAIGTIPLRLTRPSVGLRPTSELVLDGDTIDPSVSVPMAAAARSPATGQANPDWEREGCGRVERGFSSGRPGPPHP